MVHKNLAGYDTRGGAVRQLKELLKLSDEEFQQVRDIIRELTTTFDIHSKGSAQSEEWAKISDQLKNLFPAIFNSKSTRELHFAYQLALHYHRQKRRTNRSGTRRSGNHIIHTDNLSNCTPSRTSSRPLQLQITPWLAKSTTTVTMPSSSPVEPIRSSSVSYIHNFLRNCSPSLEHLLSRFIDLGFHSQEILQEVACKWTDNDRRSLMTRLAPDLNGRKMTEVEMMALEKGFYALSSKYAS